MVICPFCSSSVPSYKTNSHIIPKSFIKPLKKSGAVAYIGVIDGLLEKRQDGIKGDFICSHCEDMFSIDDSYGSVILLNTSPASNWRTTVVEKRIPLLRLTFHEISGFDFEKLKKFVLSIVLRDHCHRIVSKTSTLINNEYFELMKSTYLASPMDHSKFKIVIHKLENLTSQLNYTLSMPTMSTLGDAITFTCGGYAFMVYIDGPKDSSMLSFVDSCGLTPPGKLLMPITDFTLIGTFKNAKESIVAKLKQWEDKYPMKKKK